MVLLKLKNNLGKFKGCVALEYIHKCIENFIYGKYCSYHGNVYYILFIVL